jgi:hypothetical protein
VRGVRKLSEKQFMRCTSLFSSTYYLNTKAVSGGLLAWKKAALPGFPLQNCCKSLLCSLWNVGCVIGYIKAKHFNYSRLEDCNV